MAPDVVIAQLYALRAHLEAIILAAERSLGIAPGPALEPGSCRACGAPPDQVDDTSTMDGTRRSRCRQCGVEWERP